jgi:hypothetical protein
MISAKQQGASAEVRVRVQHDFARAGPDGNDLPHQPLIGHDWQVLRDVIGTAGVDDHHARCGSEITADHSGRSKVNRQVVGEAEQVPQLPILRSNDIRIRELDTRLLKLTPEVRVLCSQPQVTAKHLTDPRHRQRYDVID